MRLDRSKRKIAICIAVTVAMFWPALNMPDIAFHAQQELQAGNDWGWARKRYGVGA